MQTNPSQPSWGQIPHVTSTVARREGAYTLLPDFAENAVTQIVKALAEVNTDESRVETVFVEPISRAYLSNSNIETLSGLRFEQAIMRVKILAELLCDELENQLKEKGYFRVKVDASVDGVARQVHFTAGFNICL